MLAFSVQATTIYVPDDYAKIQWAVDNASAGDVIIVREGVYREHININKPLSLISENGSENTILDGNNSGSVVLVSTSDVTIDGFSIRNFGREFYDSGIRISNTFRNISIRNCNITNGKNGISGSVAYSTIEKCTVSHTSNAIAMGLVNSTIKDVWVYNNTRGLWCSFVNVSMKDVKLNNNLMGILLSGYNSFSKIENVVIENDKIIKENYPYPPYHVENKGIVITYGKNISLSNIHISRNWYGIDIYKSQNITIEQNKLERNAFAVYAHDSHTKIENNLFVNNSVVDFFGGRGEVIANTFINTGVSFSYTKFELEGNTITGRGVGIRKSGGVIMNNTIDYGGQLLTFVYPKEVVVYYNNLLGGYITFYHGINRELVKFNSTEPIDYIYKGERFRSYIGNYWRHGTDENGDGIVDSPYNGDLYPLFLPKEYYRLLLPNYNLPPVAITNGPYIGYEGSSIQFNGSASYDPNDNITVWLWDLDGDGVYETNATATHGIVSYTWKDDYSGNVSLKVIDSFGVESTNTTTVTVLNVPPTVNAGSDVEVTAGDTVYFNGSFTDPGNDTFVIEWDFGDNSTANATLTPAHTYYSKGIYNVTLKVTDDDGGVGIDNLTVTVNPIPANVTIKPETLNLKSKGEFTAFITLPEGYDIREVNVSTIVCEGAHAVKGVVADKKLVVKFNRQDLELTSGDEVTLTVAGKVYYNGGYADFEGSDVIRVIGK